jgi:dTDP-4-amino-4,6-dideoxygalactose transaminase
MGLQVKELEDKMAAYLGIKHAFACASGTLPWFWQLKPWK